MTSKRVLTIDPDKTIFQAISTMTESGFKELPVVDRTGQLLGVVSEADLLALVCNCEGTESEKIRQYISTGVPRLKEDSVWEDVEQAFGNCELARLPVVRGDRLVGMASQHEMREAIRTGRKLSSPKPSRIDNNRGDLDCRILLVEDGFANMRFLSRVLKKAGAKVAVAIHGEIALDKVVETLGEPGLDSHPAKPFDMILMDMQMPVMDGYEATRSLRYSGYTGPIIAMTGDTQTYDRRKCLDAGCDDYLAKPCDRVKLLKMIRKYVHVRLARTEAGTQ